MFTNADAADAARLDFDEREFRLVRAAAEFNKVRGELRALSSADPDVSQLRNRAEQELSIGAFDAARTWTSYSWGGTVALTGALSEVESLLSSLRAATLFEHGADFHGQ